MVGDVSGVNFGVGDYMRDAYALIGKGTDNVPIYWQ